jgi:hypothetical protein
MLKLKPKTVKKIFKASKGMLLDMKKKEYDEEVVVIQQRKMFILLQLANLSTYIVFII